MSEDSDSGSGLDRAMETTESQKIKPDEKWPHMNLPDENFTVLDPEDPAMKKFQEALKSHLTRLDQQLADEIYDLENKIKSADRVREEEGLALYEVQQEAIRQQAAIDNYKLMIDEIVRARDEVERQLEETKKVHKKTLDNLISKRQNERQLLEGIETLNALHQQFLKWEKEIAGNLSISKRISEKDAAKQKELLMQKHQKDYILLKLEEEVRKLQMEFDNLTEQLNSKLEEKIALSQTVADANADLEALEKEHKTLHATWNSVLLLINQRDKINEGILTEQKELNESLQNMELQIEKLKKESAKEMENNERLTNLQNRIGDDIKILNRSRESENERFLNLESNLIKFSKLMDQSEKEYSEVTGEYEVVQHHVKLLDKEITVHDNKRKNLEFEILTKLDAKVINDKSLRSLNNKLHEINDANVEYELRKVRTENAYGNCLLELEKVRTQIEDDKFDLNELVQKTRDKKREVDKIESEVKNTDLAYKQKERKVSYLTRKIDEMLAASDGQDMNPLDLKISTVENHLTDFDVKIQKSQQYWLRQQSHMVNLSQQRNSQMQELNSISKDIAAMEQKNYKMEVELEKRKKDEANLNKAVNALQQKLVQINARLASQNALKCELEDKNSAAKKNYIQSLQDAEMDLIKLQAEINQHCNEKVSLTDQLQAAQQEGLSWEKKVQLAVETNKCLKEERSSGGDIAMMKNEIHKMEMRLSQLQKAQEKFTQDMEYCILRRENIITNALAREKRTPKSQHNQITVLRKRLQDQRKKIKQIDKQTKQIDRKISNAIVEKKNMTTKLEQAREVLKVKEAAIPELGKKIIEAEIMKTHNLEVLIKKQRRVHLLQDMRNGRYRLSIKNENALNDELENQENINSYLRETMLQTRDDFPSLKYEIRKILLTLET